jgi:hypothetical protein
MWGVISSTTIIGPIFWDHKFTHMFWQFSEHLSDYKRTHVLVQQDNARLHTPTHDKHLLLKMVGKN